VAKKSRRKKKSSLSVFKRYDSASFNNRTVNYLFSPIFAVILWRILRSVYNLPNLDSESPFGGAVPLTLYSTLFYCYCSAYFQPDLDQWNHRPGELDFPFGGLFSSFRFGYLIKRISWPFNRIWYYMWDPFGALFTHRGVVHWPIVGVWLRVAYLYVWYLAISVTLQRFGILSPKLKIFEAWCLSFYPGTKNFGSMGFYVFCVPVYIADIFHSAVDLYESMQKGTPFCSANQKRGLIYSFFKESKDVIVSVFQNLKEYKD